MMQKSEKVAVKNEKKSKNFNRQTAPKCLTDSNNPDL